MSVEDRVRIDVWLFRARIFRTRALASAHVSGGSVRLSRAGQVRRISKPGELVGPGDELALKPNRDLVAVRILATGERRGPAPEARLLYALVTGQEPGDDASS